jgi:hypothetical protein
MIPPAESSEEEQSYKHPLVKNDQKCRLSPFNIQLLTRVSAEDGLARIILDSQVSFLL